jgi:rod shape-determining protein MreD
MTNALPKYILIFIVLIAAQVFVFDKIQLSGFINPYMYVLFILMLPFEMSGWLLLLISFFTGLSVDFFEQTPGIHAAACVFMGYSRPGIIRLVGARDAVEAGHYPNIRDLGVLWFFTYTIILVFLHHLFLFFIEAFRFSEFFFTLLKVLINTALSTILIMFIEFLFYSREQR